MKRRVLVVTLLILVAIASLGGAQARKGLPPAGLRAGAAQLRTLVPLPVDWQGDLDGVPYRIIVPANWNGTLLVYEHGYGEGTNPPALVPPQTDTTAAPLRTTLVSHGYALAASQMAGTGWQVKEGMQDTVALTSAFRDMVGKPLRTIIWGRSMGALMSLGLIEKFPGLFDGAIALCAPAAGTPRRFDQALDIALAYSVVFNDWSPAWGSPGDMADDLDYPTYLANVKPVFDAHNTKAADQGKWAFIRMVNNIPETSWSLGSSARVLALFFATAVRAELELRAGGAIAENIGKEYTLTDDQKAQLAAMDLNADALLAEMNAPAMKVAADPNARNYAEHYVDPSGRIRRPVLTLHTKGDPIATPANEGAYYTTVHDQGNSDLLLQVFTNGTGHCTFTSAQERAAVAAMMSWLDTGSKPGASYFTAPGFDFAYPIPAWPR